MTDDRELLRQYAEDGSEPAFAELVRRHVDLVYSAALRQMSGDAHRAQEVTSMTFATLARKAGSLLRHPVLPAWLYRTAYLSAAMLKRGEARRSAHERAAAVELAVLEEGGAAADWEQARPVLDAAMAELGERDREAIILRFFSNAPFGEVGRRLGLSENAARMRVDRAIEKLRSRLASRGVTSTAAALGVVLSEQAVAAAPAGVTAGVMSAAFAGAKAGAGLGLLQFMAASKFQIAGWAAVLAVGGGFVAVEQRAEAKLASEVAAQSGGDQDLSEQRQEADALKAHLHDLEALQAQADLAAAAQKRLAAARAETGQLLRAQRASTVPKVPPRLGEIYNINQLDKQPLPVQQIRPQFPLEARRAGRGGTVTVDFVVAPDGSVVNAMAASSTDRELEGAAVAAVSQWQFKAGERQGSAVAVHMQVPIVFSFASGGSKPSGPPPSEWFNVDGFAAQSDAFTIQTGGR